PTMEEEQPVDMDTAHKRPAWADTLQTAAQKRDSGTRKRTLRLILADDHTILRKSLANLLETHEEFVIVAEAGDGESALQQTVSIVPDVLLLDLNMPIRSGLDILPEIRKTVPSVKVLILTGREEDAYIVRALRAGAHGYILKSADENDLVEALKKVAQGQLVLGRGVAEKIVGGVLSDQAPDSVRLSDLDQRVLLHIATGKDNEQISNELNIPLIELIEQIANIMKKLGSKDRYATALKALREGYILLDDLQDLDRLA
ncbi:MAG TPA: response regulator transcription factor, partial [Aggregatilineales bacterium]|nr:response regulator transcription factor [Aggregatilineales bacterium]